MISRLLISCAFVALAACTGAENTLDISGNATAADPAIPQVDNLPPPPAGGANVFFAPIVGAPVAKVTALSRQLSATAPTIGIQLSPGRASNLTHEIRGYFSALSEGNSTTVIHVWDVFTPDGQRVHRIQAQQVVAGSAADPWTIVPDETMATIAQSVLDEYNRWRASNQTASASPAQLQ